MIGALRYEWVRIRTIASTYWMSGLAVVLTAGLALLLATTVSRADIGEVGITDAVLTNIVVLGGGSLAAVPIVAAAFMAVLGALSMGHEYRYGTNKATLCALPDRLKVIAAKLVILTAWVAGVVVVIVAVDLVIAALFMDQMSIGSEGIRPALAYLFYCEGSAVAGFGLAAIFRNQTGAIAAVLVWPFVIEPIIYTVLTVISRTSNASLGKLTNLLPASAGRRTIFDPYSVFAGFGGSIRTWGLTASFIVFAIGVLVVMVAGSMSFITRDA